MGPNFLVAVPPFCLPHHAMNIFYGFFDSIFVAICSVLRYSLTYSVIHAVNAVRVGPP